jgi:hypothetical protein
MQPFTLKYHRPGAAAPPSAFFILSRGAHTGRPAYVPNVNSFVFTCAPQDLTSYYWLVYSLWYTHQFKEILKGSCIEFARVDDLRQLIAQKAPTLSDMEGVVNSLKRLQETESKIRKQLALIQQARRSLLKIG